MRGEASKLGWDWEEKTHYTALINILEIMNEFWLSIETTINLIFCRMQKISKTNFILTIYFLKIRTIWKKRYNPYNFRVKKILLIRTFLPPCIYSFYQETRWEKTQISKFLRRRQPENRPGNPGLRSARTLFNTEF